MAISEGAFVWTCFPTSEAPREPGLRHVCYCVAASTRLAVMAYTSSQPWTLSVLPMGVRVFGTREAGQLNQRPFVLYLNRLATLPLSPRWFPTLGRPQGEVVAVASANLRIEMMAVMQDLLRRHRDLVENLGPGA